MFDEYAAVTILMLCNREIKFDVFMDIAMIHKEQTLYGHYCQKKQTAGKR
jgi:tRNA U34 2-thiouridine synthase MnmA/TrmU